MIHGIANAPLQSGVVRYVFGTTLGYGWTEAQKAAYRAALQVWSDVTNVDFVEVAETDQYDSIVFGVTPEQMAIVVPSEYSHIAFTAYQYLPVDGSPTQGFYQFGQESLRHLDPGDRGFWVMVHEIGHMLGLDHPHNEVVGSGIDMSIDTHRLTVMSYNHALGGDMEGQHWATPSYLDIQQMHEWYGPREHATGNDVYRLTPAYSATIYDTDGIDGIMGTKRGDVIDLRDGGQVSKIKGSKAKFNVALGSEIENAFGGRGEDKLIANSSVNNMHGGAGDDLFLFHSIEEGDTIWAFQTGHDRLNLRALDVDRWTFSGHTLWIDNDLDAAWDFALLVNKGKVVADDLIL